MHTYVYFKLVIFNSGVPESIELPGGEKIHGSLELFILINKMAAEHGVGRVDIVENRFLGLKVSRVKQRADPIV